MDAKIVTETVRKYKAGEISIADASLALILQDASPEEVQYLLSMDKDLVKNTEKNG